MAGSLQTLTAHGTDGSINKLHYSFTGDDATGAVPTAVLPSISGLLLLLVTHPGAPAPTDNYDITLVDGDDPSHVFTASFFNPGSVGGEMGFRRSGEANGAGLFDNLIITAVPEPVSVATVLLGLSGLGLWVRRRRK